MDLYRLPADLAMQATPVDAGWARAIRRGPSTITGVLQRAVAEMEEADRLEELARDPVRYYRAHSRRLIDRLLRR